MAQMRTGYPQKKVKKLYAPAGARFLPFQTTELITNAIGVRKLWGKVTKQEKINRLIVSLQEGRKLVLNMSEFRSLLLNIEIAQVTFDLNFTVSLTWDRVILNE